MLIIIQPEELWQEFVYYRKAGLHATAFMYIRREAEPTEWQCIIASLAHRKYNMQLGDIIKIEKTDFSVVWDECLDNNFKRSVIHFT